MTVNLLHAKPFWLVYYCDGDLHDSEDAYMYDDEGEPHFQIFETEDAAQAWAKEQVTGGYWEHCVIIRASSLGTFSKAAVYTPTIGAPKQSDTHGADRRGKRKLELNE